MTFIIQSSDALTSLVGFISSLYLNSLRLLLTFMFSVLCLRVRFPWAKIVMLKQNGLIVWWPKHSTQIESQFFLENAILFVDRPILYIG